jgi:hypothetical protein
MVQLPGYNLAHCLGQKAGWSRTLLSDERKIYHSVQLKQNFVVIPSGFLLRHKLKEFQEARLEFKT